MSAEVIGISGPPGAGKTTLATALAQQLGDACVLSMDHYQSMTRMPIEEVQRWVERGADIDELPVGPLATHLARLKGGRSVVDPATGAAIPARRYIVFDTHFGRTHHATGGLIDVMVWLDTPPDIALARNVRGFIQPLLGAQHPKQAQDRLLWIDGYLANYEAVVSRLVHMQAERVAAGADIVIERRLAPHEAAEKIGRFLAARG